MYVHYLVPFKTLNSPKTQYHVGNTAKFTAQQTNFKFVNCKRPLKKQKFTDITLNVIIYSWCRTVNRILSGKITYGDGEDTTKSAAQNYFNKHKNYKNRK